MVPCGHSASYHTVRAVAAAVAAGSDARGLAAVARRHRLGWAAPSPWAAGGSPGAVRRFGVMDGLQSSLEERKEKKVEAKREQLFKAQIDFLCSVENYSLAKHMIALEDGAKAAGLTGWKSTFRSSDQQRELEDRFAEMNIGKALTPAELENPKLIRRVAKLRIATAVGVGVDRVNKFLAAYDQAKGTHEYVRSRLARGMPLPKSEAEYQKMLMTDRKGVSTKRVQKAYGRIRSARALMRR